MWDETVLLARVLPPRPAHFSLVPYVIIRLRKRVTEPIETNLVHRLRAVIQRNSVSSDQLNNFSARMEFFPLFRSGQEEPIGSRRQIAIPTQEG